jgi:hypothetical protein
MFRRWQQAFLIAAVFLSIVTTNGESWYENLCAANNDILFVK